MYLCAYCMASADDKLVRSEIAWLEEQFGAEETDKGLHEFASWPHSKLLDEVGLAAKALSEGGSGSAPASDSSSLVDSAPTKDLSWVVWD